MSLSGATLAPVFTSATTDYTADVSHGVTETTVTPTSNDDGATYAVKLGGVADADGTVSLSAGGNVITVEVTAEDGSAAKTYTVTVTRAGPPLTASIHDQPQSHDGADAFTFKLRFSEEFPASYKTLRDHAFTVTNGEVTQARRLAQGSNTRWDITAAPDSNSGVTVVLPVTTDCDAQGAICAGDGRMLSNRTVLTVPGPLSTDATLSGLTLSGVALSPAFASGTGTYTADVGNAVTETTVTPTANDDGASSVIKLGGVADAGGTVSLAVGGNVITVEVTAEDGSAVKTYTVTVTRAGPLSTDATLSGLSLSRVTLFPAFDPATTRYTASVGNGVTRTTVTAATNDDGATHAIKRGGVADDDGVISLAVGSNVITVEVTAEDGSAVKTYTVTATRAAASSIPSKSAPAEYTKHFVGKATSRYDSEGRDATLTYYNRAASIDGQWYVFIIDENDLVIAHYDATRRGLDVNGPVATGANGYNFGPAMLSATEGGKWVSYVYSNPATNGPGVDHTSVLEYKHVWVVRHDGLLFASGWHAPADEYTRFLVDEAIGRYDSEGREAFLDYYNSSGSVDGQWYVFVADAEGNIIGHHDPDVVGTDLEVLLGTDTFEAGEWVTHQDINPATGKLEAKRFWVVQHDGLVFGSGWHHDEPGN